jgi:hypothetical protein
VAKAPAITSIEASFASNYTLMDSNNLVALGRSLDIEYETVVVHAEESELPTTLASEGGTGAPSPTISSQQPSPAEEYQSEADSLPPIKKPSGLDSSFKKEILPGITFIGDSVSLGAQASMMEAIPDLYMDSVVSRPVSAGVELLNELQARDELREIVVLALGTNETANYAKYFTQMIEELPAGHRLVIVTPFEGRGNEYSRSVARIANWQRELPEEYDFITIADWAALIATQVNILASDKTHLGGRASMNLYTACVVEALEVAAEGPAKE